MSIRRRSGWLAPRKRRPRSMCIRRWRRTPTRTCRAKYRRSFMMRPKEYEEFHIYCLFFILCSHSHLNNIHWTDREQMVEIMINYESIISPVPVVPAIVVLAVVAPVWAIPALVVLPVGAAAVVLRIPVVILVVPMLFIVLAVSALSLLVTLPISIWFALSLFIPVSIAVSVSIVPLPMILPWPLPWYRVVPSPFGPCHIPISPVAIPIYILVPPCPTRTPTLAVVLSTMAMMTVVGSAVLAIVVWFHGFGTRTVVCICYNELQLI